MIFLQNGCRNNHLRLLLAMTILASQSQTAMGLDFSNPLEQLKLIKPSRNSLILNQENLKLNIGFRLFNKGKVSFEEAIKSEIRNHINPIIQIQTVHSDEMSLVTGSSIKSFKFQVANTPICNAQVKAHHQGNGQAFLIGNTPQINASEAYISKEWPNKSNSVDTFSTALTEEGVKGSFQIISASKCYFVRNGGLENVWKIRGSFAGLPYVGFADEYEMYSFEKAYFNVEGTAQLYKSSPSNGQVLESTPIFDLIGDGTLNTEFLTSAPKGYSRVKSDTHTFSYVSSSPQYDEVASFVYAQQHQKYFENIGFTWYGPKPMVIKVHEKPNGESNNALFMPAEGRSVPFPTIFIGDGDGEVLDNLPKDADVVSHEFGHHVVYKNLKSTRGESLILHEGLADFFVFSKSGDACLGESICPVGTPICWVDQCLRTAENELIYGDNFYKHSAPHQKGQLISGFLWDMNLAGTVPLAQLERVVLRAVDLLVEDSGIEHFMLALFNADAELYNGANRDAMLVAANNRGLSDFVTKIGEAGTAIPLPVDVQQDSSLVLTPGNETEKDDSDEPFDRFLGKYCGTIGVEHSSKLQLFGLFLFFMMPFAAMGIMPKPQPIKVKKNTNPK